MPRRVRHPGLHDAKGNELSHRLVDTMVRGLVYEAGGTVDAALLEEGADAVREAHRRWHMPTEVVDADPADYAVWLAAMIAAVDRLLSA